ncbi:MAG: hypothetical protein LQ349_005487 [Xanthoria aureola]|nr:MAG: hypothetical protein LQ349_005487 [Xanthoria aureola]
MDFQTTLPPTRAAMVDPDFPCSLVISIPLPTYRLASSALRALQVDAELSSLVRRSFSLVSLTENDAEAVQAAADAHLPIGEAPNGTSDGDTSLEEKTVLRTEYKATTNRMLRVSVNGFFESMGVVLGVMQELDVDVLAEERKLDA